MGSESKDGTLYLYKSKPEKKEDLGLWKPKTLAFLELEGAPIWVFKNVQWKDKEPKEWDEK